MEANGLTKCSFPCFCLGCGELEHVMIDDEMVHDLPIKPSTPPSHNASVMATEGVLPTAVTPTSIHKRHRSNSFHNHDRNSSFVSYPNCHAARYCSNDCLQKRCSTDSIRGVCENVALAQARVQHLEEHIANSSKGTAVVMGHQQQQHGESLPSLREQLFTEKIHLIDALVMMGWEHYRCILAESESFETAEAAVRHIYEEALDLSIQLFCSSPPASINHSINSDRLMILLLILDFDEYCETLLEYQLSRECISAEAAANDADMAAGVSCADNSELRIEDILNSTTRGNNYLQQLHELWKSGVFEQFDPTLNDEEDHFAKIHAAGLCLVLFRKLESQRDRQHTDLNAMESQFWYLFDDYLPKQLTQPSMNNIIATKYARVLFQDGTPTVYWSLLADSYRKEWGEYFERENSECGDEAFDMEMDYYDDEDDDEDDGK
mmetsp:Transcript_13317/g.37491  ORF Transcript_13317/g.37491 Transcript_13317/m.37491 type:complete len:436 (-) Transcript_13317:322-1629(-)